MRGSDPDALGVWIRDAMGCGIHTMQEVAVELRYDISGRRKAICEPWNNGRTKGQINRLKNAQTLNVWASQCRISPSRMRLLHEIEDHQV